MKVLHITPSSNGFEEVTLLSNQFSRKNSLTLIEKGGKEHITGGFILEDNPTNRAILNSFGKDEQYNVVKSLRIPPFKKLYHEE